MKYAYCILRDHRSQFAIYRNKGYNLRAAAAAMGEGGVAIPHTKEAFIVGTLSLSFDHGSR